MVGALDPASPFQGKPHHLTLTVSDKAIIALLLQDPSSLGRSDPGSEVAAP